MYSIDINIVVDIVAPTRTVVAGSLNIFLHSQGSA